MGITIAVENHSTVVTDEQVGLWVMAMNIQVGAGSRLAAYWGERAHLVQLAPGTAKAPDWLALILDDSDQAGALGYHDDASPWGAPQMKVFAKTDKDYGLSASVTLSHEVLEALVDPWLGLAFQTSDTEFYAVEVGDPVEADEFGYTLNGILVSDYVLPEWFIPGSPGPYSVVGAKIAAGELKGRSPSVTAPLEIAPGGYASVFVSGQGWTQRSNGEHAPDPDDPRDRTVRRAG